MVEAMVGGAEGGQVGRVVAAAVLAVDDVVDLQPAGLAATGHATRAVAVEDEAPGAVGDGVLGGADADRTAWAVNVGLIVASQRRWSRSQSGTAMPSDQRAGTGSVGSRNQLTRNRSRGGWWWSRRGSGGRSRRARRPTTRRPARRGTGRRGPRSTRRRRCGRGRRPTRRGGGSGRRRRTSSATTPRLPHRRLGSAAGTGSGRRRSGQRGRGSAAGRRWRPWLARRRWHRGTPGPSWRPPPDRPTAHHSRTRPSPSGGWREPRPAGRPRGLDQARCRPATSASGPATGRRSPSHDPVANASAASSTSSACSTLRCPQTARKRSSMPTSGEMSTPLLSIST